MVGGSLDVAAASFVTGRAILSDPLFVSGVFAMSVPFGLFFAMSCWLTADFFTVSVVVVVSFLAGPELVAPGSEPVPPGFLSPSRSTTWLIPWCTTGTGSEALRQGPPGIPEREKT